MWTGPSSFIIIIVAMGRWVIVIVIAIIATGLTGQQVWPLTSAHEGRIRWQGGDCSIYCSQKSRIYTAGMQCSICRGKTNVFGPDPPSPPKKIQNQPNHTKEYETDTIFYFRFFSLFLSKTMNMLKLSLAVGPNKIINIGNECHACHLPFRDSTVFPPAWDDITITITQLIVSYSVQNVDY